MDVSLTLINLAGSIALLLWGLHMVQSGIQRAFGPQLRRFLGRTLRDRGRALLAGLGVTAVLQSSTATGLMAAGFAADSADPPAVQVICYSVPNTAAAIFTGSGVMVNATLEAPDGGMAVQEIEVEGDSEPSVGV